jgi:cytochrome P450
VQRGHWLWNHAFSEFLQPIGQLHAELLLQIPNDGMICLRGLFGAPKIFLTSPKSLADVLVHRADDFEKLPGERKILRAVVGDGLVTAEGDVHYQQKRKLLAGFTPPKIRALYPVFWKEATALTQQIRRTLTHDGSGIYTGTTDMVYWAPRVSMDMIGAAGFGQSFHSLRDADSEIIHCYEKAFAIGAGHLLCVFADTLLPRIILQWLPWPRWRQFRQNIDSIRDFCHQWVTDAKATSALGDGIPNNLLANMIHTGEYTFQELIEQVRTFLAAGYAFPSIPILPYYILIECHSHENTSSVVMWVMLALASDSQLQSRLRQELQANLPEVELDEVDLAILEQLPLLNAVVSEAIRLFPPLPIGNRIAIRDTTVMNHPIPKGTPFLIVPRAINRSSELWGPDADRFNADRWINPDTGRFNNHGGASSNYSFLSFFHGPHNCIGQNFARAELRTVVAAVIRSFDMVLDNPAADVSPVGWFTPRPADGVKVKLRSLV